MSIPISILARTFGLIFAEPANTVKVIAPGLIACGVAAALFMASVSGLNDDGSDVPRITNPLFFALAIGLAILGVIMFAVFWHRHALLQGDERDTVMRPHGGAYSQYLWGAILVFLITFAAALPGGFVIGIVSAIFSASSSASFLIGFALGVALSVIVSWVALRVSLILPAAAIGQKLKVSESWQATGPLSYDIFWTAVLLSLLNVVATALFGGLAAALPALALPANLFLMVLQSLIYVSVLSTLYGHLIQGRALT